MKISIDHLTWKPVSKDGLAKVINDLELMEKLSNLSSNLDFSTTRRFIYLKRRDGRTIIQPKNGTEPYCFDCENKIGHKSPVNYLEKEDEFTHKLIKIPYCVNEDRYDTL